MLAVFLVLTALFMLPREGRADTPAEEKRKVLPIETPKTAPIEALTPLPVEKDKPLPEQASEILPMEERNTFSLYLENDNFVSGSDDSQYTNGIKLTWSSALTEAYPDWAWTHRWLYPLIKHLPFEKQKDRRRNITFSLGQSMYTPEDIEIKERIPDDRPYAGMLYTEMGFHSRTDRDMDSMELLLGLVGPEAFAEETQKAIHDIFDFVDPEGWDHQLQNEPVVCIIYEHKKKLFMSGIGSGFGYDGVLNTGGGLGNVMTYYNLGFSLRVGWNLPDDFGSFPIRPVSSINGAFGVPNPKEPGSKRIGVHLFSSIEGRAVLHDIFLDGNTFTSDDNSSVDKEPIVADIVNGVCVTRERLKITFAYVIRTDEFDEQDETMEFGSLSVSFAF
jgi:lipid A 3-O-deacylase